MHIGRKTIWCIPVAILIVVTALSLYIIVRVPNTNILKIATTTSLYDTGLLDVLESRFERKYGIDLHIISVGTGIALNYGERGDVDVLLIHDKIREEEFIRKGYGIERVPIAYNYFLIVGPSSDPANISGINAENAFKRIMEMGKKNPDIVRFVSRGDESGTHAREKIIWEKSGYRYEDIRVSGAWYIESGRGMGATLLMANELSAYTLTDLGTFIAFVDKTDLKILIETDDALLNVYSAIAINPKMFPQVNFEGANQFITFLCSEETQQLIEMFGIEKYGRPLFYPIVKLNVTEEI